MDCFFPFSQVFILLRRKYLFVRASSSRKRATSCQYSSDVVFLSHCVPASSPFPTALPRAGCTPPGTCLGRSSPGRNCSAACWGCSCSRPTAAMHSSPRHCCHGTVGNRRGSKPFTTAWVNTLRCQPVQTSYQPWSLAWLPQEWPGHPRASVSSSLKEKGQRWTLIADICIKSTLSVIFCRTKKNNLCYVSLLKNFNIHHTQRPAVWEPFFFFFC